MKRFGCTESEISSVCIDNSLCCLFVFTLSLMWQSSATHSFSFVKGFLVVRQTLFFSDLFQRLYPQSVLLAVLSWRGSAHFQQHQGRELLSEILFII